MVILESEFKNLAYQAQKCMRLSTGLAAIALILPVIISWIILWQNRIDIPHWINILSIAWGVFWIGYFIIAPLIRYRRYRYFIDEDKIVVKKGLWFITEDFAPIERVHQITVKSGPIDRLYGLANVIATTAGGTVSIHFLEKEVAENIAFTLQAKVRYILKQQGISLEGMPNALDYDNEAKGQEVRGDE